MTQPHRHFGVIEVDCNFAPPPEEDAAEESGKEGSSSDSDEEEEEEEKKTEEQEQMDDIFGEEEDEDAPPLETHHVPEDHDEIPIPSQEHVEVGPRHLVHDEHDSPETKDHHIAHGKNTIEEHKRVTHRKKLVRRMSKQDATKMQDLHDEHREWQNQRLSALKKKGKNIKVMLMRQSIRGAENVNKLKAEVKSCISELAHHSMKDSQTFRSFKALYNALDNLDVPDSLRPTREPERDSNSAIVRSRLSSKQEDHMEEAKGDRGIPSSSKRGIAHGESIFALCCRRHNTLHPHAER